VGEGHDARERRHDVHGRCCPAPPLRVKALRGGSREALNTYPRARRELRVGGARDARAAAGEYFIGQWKKDKKAGLGVYVWGTDAGDVAGDKYEGNVRSRFTPHPRPRNSVVRRRHVLNAGCRARGPSWGAARGGADLSAEQFENGLPHGVGRTVMKDGGFHKGRYFEGQMHGFGVMQTWDGFMYQGKWKHDELHGDVMASFVFGSNEANTREVQIYDNGNLIGTREFDPTKDWSEVQVPAHAAGPATGSRLSLALRLRGGCHLVVHRSRRSPLVKRALGRQRGKMRATLLRRFALLNPPLPARRLIPE